MPNVTCVSFDGNRAAPDCVATNNLRKAGTAGVARVMPEGSSAYSCSPSRYGVAEEQLGLARPVDPAGDVLASERRPNMWQRCQCTAMPEMGWIRNALHEVQV